MEENQHRGTLTSLTNNVPVNENTATVSPCAVITTSVTESATAYQPLRVSSSHSIPNVTSSVKPKQSSVNKLVQILLIFYLAYNRLYTKEKS